jgi:hypothetical protein
MGLRPNTDDLRHFRLSVSYGYQRPGCGLESRRVRRNRNLRGRITFSGDIAIKRGRCLSSAPGRREGLNPVSRVNIGNPPPADVRTASVAA